MSLLDTPRLEPSLLEVTHLSNLDKMRLFKLLYVYILECSDGTYYTGVTNNPDRRLIIHNMGLNKEAYTFSRRPLKMVYCEAFKDYNSALEWETRIKKWGRKKKEALIQDNYHLLPELSKKKNWRVKRVSSSTSFG